MFAAVVSPMEFLTRFHGFMSRVDAHDNLVNLLDSRSPIKTDYSDVSFDPFPFLGESMEGLRVMPVELDKSWHLLPVLTACAYLDRNPFYVFLYLDDKLQFQVYVPMDGDTPVTDYSSIQREFMSDFTPVVLKSVSETLGA